MRVKKTIYITRLKPVLCYGCETWKLTSKTRSKTQATEMRALRAIYKCNKFGPIKESSYKRSFGSRECTGLCGERTNGMLRTRHEDGGAKISEEVLPRETRRKKTCGTPKNEMENKYPTGTAQPLNDECCEHLKKIVR